MLTCEELGVESTPHPPPHPHACHELSPLAQTPPVVLSHLAHRQWQPEGPPVPECLLDGLVSLVAVLHAHQAGGPLLQDALFLHVDGIYFRAGLQWRVEVTWMLVLCH